MHQLLKAAAIGLMFCAPATIAADCIAPEVPSMPDGSSASMEEMIAGQKAVKAFQAANLQYMGCLDPLIESAKSTAVGDEATADDIQAVKSLEQQYNSAVSAEEALAEGFNSQIRAYKEANPQ